MAGWISPRCVVSANAEMRRTNEIFAAFAGNRCVILHGAAPHRRCVVGGVGGWGGTVPSRKTRTAVATRSRLAKTASIKRSTKSATGRTAKAMRPVANATVWEAYC
jgi:hypothetical protein